MIKASDIMKTDFRTVTPDTTVEELGRMFIELGVSGMPVMDGDDLFGIVTENDLISQNKELHIPTVLQIFDAIIPIGGYDELEHDILRMSAKVVREICTKKPITVTPEATLSELATIMSGKKAHHLPVLKDGKLVGLIDQHDVIRGISVDRKEPQP